MDILNYKTGKTVQQLRYEFDGLTYTFENDIKVGEWTVGRMIIIRGPKESIYKYNFKNYFEFVVTDCNGDSQVLTWNHNAGDKALKAFWGDSSADALSFFFAEHPVFSAKDWADYKSLLALKDIKSVMDSDMYSSTTKIKRISKIVDGVLN